MRFVPRTRAVAVLGLLIVALVLRIAAAEPQLLRQQVTAEILGVG